MNILRYKQKAVGSTYQELAGNDGGWNSSSNNSSYQLNTDPNNVDVYGYTINSTPEMTGTENNAGKLADDNVNNQPAYTPDTSSSSEPSIWQRLGIVPGMTSDQYFNQETEAQKNDRMGLVNNALGTVGNAAMYSNPIAATGMSLGNIYNSYDSNKSVADNLSSIFSPAQLAGFATKALGMPTQVSQGLSGAIGLATSKDPIATAAGFLNGQIGSNIGKNLSSYTGINMTPFYSNVATKGLNTIFNTARKTL